MPGVIPVGLKCEMLTHGGQRIAREAQSEIILLRCRAFSRRFFVCERLEIQPSITAGKRGPRANEKAPRMPFDGQARGFGFLVWGRPWLFPIPYLGLIAKFEFSNGGQARLVHRCERLLACFAVDVRPVPHALDCDHAHVIVLAQQASP